MGFLRFPAYWESHEKARDAKLREILAAYNEAWRKYWEWYIKLQDQL